MSDPATETIMADMTFEEWQGIDRYVQWNVMRNLREESKGLEAASTAAEELLISTYRALHRGHWEEGETEAELCSRILDFLCNYFDWPNQQEGEG